MMLMVTNRARRKGEYSDKPRPNFGYDYLYEFEAGQAGPDRFAGGGKRGFEAALLREMIRLRVEEGINTPKVGVYLHGYNNDWQESVDELFDLHAALLPETGYAPIIVGFSWPSAGNAASYLSDREQVRDSVPAFTRFLGDIHRFLLENERKCFSTTFCIAHSMGNYLLRKGMEYLSDHLGTPVGRAMFNETAMLAPDIAAADIEVDGKGRYIADFSRRVHVYYSRHDRALKASSAKRFGANRLGRHGPEEVDEIPENVVAINAGNFANSESVLQFNLRDRRGEAVSVHSSHRYHPKIISDVVDVLSSIDRNLIEGRRIILDIEADLETRPNHFMLEESGS